MKHLILLVAFLVVAAGGCSNNTPPPEQSRNAPVPSPTTIPATQTSITATPINAFCAVDKDDPVDPAVTYLYQGKVIGFCCESCIAKFKKDPDKYMKDLK